MKILLITSEYPPFKGGVANYYWNLVKAWPGSENLAVLDNSRHELISQSGYWPWRIAFKAVSHRIKTDKIDYLFVGQVLPLGVVAWWLSLFRPLRYAVFFHGMDLSYSLRYFHKKFLVRMIVRRADKVICANSYVKRQVDKYYSSGGGKAVIVNPGVIQDIPEPREELLTHLQITYGLSSGGNSITIFTLGRLVKRKGVDRVIAALQGLPEELLNRITYYVGGLGPDEEYLKASVPAKLKDRVVFLGELKEDEKWAWLSSCDIFIMPARDINGDYEGFGIVYLEANLCGKPVIAGLAGGVSDAVINGFNGLMVDPDDIDSIRAAIIKLSLDEDYRHHLGQNGKDRAREQFNWPIQAKKLSSKII